MANPTPTSTDVLVLGAGIVGVSVALHLQRRGRSVVLVDRREPGRETSYGNAGLIQRDGFYPYGFPRQLGTLLRYARNRSTDVHYHPLALPSLAPFLARYWYNSGKASMRRIADSSMKLIDACISEHDALVAEAGAGDLLRRNGWLKLFRTGPGLEAAILDAEFLKAEFGNPFSVHDGAGVAALEPHLRMALAGGLLWPATVSVRDPAGLVRAYAELFRTRGGSLVRGEARSLRQDRAGWTVETAAGRIRGGAAVAALGPWSGELAAQLGHRLPILGKRGYHMHYSPSPGASLNRPLSDVEAKYLVAPMAQGIRLTTGIEFARAGAPATPVQLGRAERRARELFPVDRPLDGKPWLGARPCTPDMLPVIGPAGRHASLWFCTGHAHHGLTLGPASGRLLAEMMTGQTPFIDPTPYRPDRF